MSYLIQNNQFSEPFLEALPEAHLSLILLTLYHAWDIGFYTTKDNEIILIISFVTSVISSAFGIAKFLLKGPLKIHPPNGFLSGYGQPSFILNFVTTLTCLVSKAFWLYWLLPEAHLNNTLGTCILIWVGCSIVPQFILSLSLMVYHFGILTTMKLTMRWPAIILTPTFSPFMFNQEVRNGSKVLILSKKWTIINLLIPMVGILIGYFTCYFYVLTYSEDIMKQISKLIVQRPYMNGLCYLAISMSGMMVSLVLTICLFYIKWFKIQRTCIDPNKPNKH